MRPPLAHIGYHKTATSWLQQRFFDPRFGFQKYPRHLIARAFVKPQPFSFDARACRSQIGAWTSEVRRRGLVPVLSHERLTGYPHSGGFDSREIVERLAAVLPRARILIVVREQRSMILSNYHQYLRDGGASPLGRYLDPPQTDSRRMPGFAVEFLQYDRLVETYRAYFGEENVCVLAYEQFCADPLGFLERIRDFAEVEADLSGLDGATTRAVMNRAPSAMTLAVLRWVNLLFRANPLHPSPPVPSHLASAAGARLALRLQRMPLGAVSSRRSARERAIIARRVEGAYEDSNTRLSEIARVDLSGFGYAVRAA